MSGADTSGLPYRKGVGAVVFNGEGRVLVARRIDTPGNAWQLPQGGIDDGEEPAAAILREVREEVGLTDLKVVATASRWFRYDLPDHLVGKVWKGRYRGQEQLWFALRFFGADGQIDLNHTDSPEFDAWRWVPLADLPALAVDFKRSLYAFLVEEFAPVVAGSGRGA